MKFLKFKNFQGSPPKKVPTQIQPVDSQLANSELLNSNSNINLGSDGIL